MVLRRSLFSLRTRSCSMERSCSTCPERDSTWFCKASMVPVSLVQEEGETFRERRRGTKEIEKRGVPLTSLSFAARPCCPSPACGWCVPALWPSRPAARTLWRAARSCPGGPPAASTGTTGQTHRHAHLYEHLDTVTVHICNSSRGATRVLIGCHKNVTALSHSCHCLILFICQ